MNLPDEAALRSLFDILVPQQFWAHLEQEAPWRQRGIYRTPLVIELMLWQKLHDNATLAAAVEQVVLGHASLLLPAHKRLREGTVSSNTGAYSQARTGMPVAVVRAVLEQICAQVRARAGEEEVAKRTYVVDGSSVVLPHTAELVQDFPPAVNQHGVAHWPVLKAVVVHNLWDGTALPPCWGPMYGSAAVSEQGLLQRLLPQLPPRAILLGDRNFGVFATVYAAHQHHHPVLVRLTKARAERMYGGTLPKRTTDCEVDWSPSKAERRKHHFPAEAHVRGRLLVWRVKRRGQFLTLILFTTLDLPAEEIVALYGRRWYIETDLRTLKQALGLGALRAQTPTMVEKELLITVAAYNLVRAVQSAAAHVAAVEPRQLSFARTLVVVQTWRPTLLRATTECERQRRLQQMLRSAMRGQLPRRKRRRCYPRAVWGRPQVFPRRKAVQQKGGCGRGKK